MKFRTEVLPDPAFFGLGYRDRIMTLGSCFAKHISNRLIKHRYTLLHNPFGVLYNPVSINRCVDLLKNAGLQSGQELVFYNGEWHSFLFDSTYSNPDAEACLDKINSTISMAQSWLKETTVLIITYGTSFIFSHKEKNEVVANCHKIPAKEFDHRLLSIDEIKDTISNTIRMVHSMNPECRLIFTVSPVRHWKNGAVNNQLSKAQLLLALHTILKSEPRSFYFPAYEIMMDDLRDYRYYEKDMLHPNEQAVDYIWELFVNTFISRSDQAIMKDIEKIDKARSHRPRSRASKSHKNFLFNQLKRIESLQKAYPWLDLFDDREYFKSQLE